MNNACIEDLLIKLRCLIRSAKREVVYSNNKLIAINKLKEAEYLFSQCKCNEDLRRRYEP